jgi:hypothetical protein
MGLPGFSKAAFCSGILLFSASLIVLGTCFDAGSHRWGKYRERRNHPQALEYIPYQAIIQAH